MILSDNDITKFQALYKSQFGIEITKEDACEKGTKLLELMSAIYKPMTKEKDKTVKQIINYYNKQNL